MFTPLTLPGKGEESLTVCHEYRTPPGGVVVHLGRGLGADPGHVGQILGTHWDPPRGAGGGGLDESCLRLLPPDPSLDQQQKT